MSSENIWSDGPSDGVRIIYTDCCIEIYNRTRTGFIWDMGRHFPKWPPMRPYGVLLTLSSESMLSVRTSDVVRNHCYIAYNWTKRGIIWDMDSGIPNMAASGTSSVYWPYPVTKFDQWEPLMLQGSVTTTAILCIRGQEQVSYGT